jgi:DNA polymerase-3 subunit epsilon
MEQVKPIIFFDTETTGLSTVTDRIVELYAAKVQNGDVIAEYHQFFNPGFPVPQEAINVHHITNEFLADKPSFESKALEIAEFFKDCYVCGHNGRKYDVPLLSEELGRAGIVWPTDLTTILDTYQVEKTLLSHSLIATYKRYFGKDYSETIGDAHGAKADTLATIAVFKEQCKRIDADASTQKGIDAFYKAGRPDEHQADVAGNLVYDDAHELCWNFGKNRGRKVKDTFSYATWVLGQNFAASTKALIRKELSI